MVGMYKISIFLAAISDWQLGCSGVHYTVAVISSRPAHMLFLSLWCPHAFPPTSTYSLSFITFLHFHFARSLSVHLILLSHHAVRSPTPLPAVHQFSGCHWVLHLTWGVSWLTSEIAVFPWWCFLPAAFGSPEICLSPSISLWIPPSVITQQMVTMLGPSSFILDLVPPRLPVILLQLVPQNHHPLLA